MVIAAAVGFVVASVQPMIAESLENSAAVPIEHAAKMVLDSSKQYSAALIQLGLHFVRSCYSVRSISVLESKKRNNSNN